MLTAAREVQIPLLAVMLLGACAAKIWRALRPHTDTARTDLTGLFPAHLQRPIMVRLGYSEPCELRRLPVGGDHDRPARQLPMAQVRGPDLRRSAVRCLAGRVLAVRGVPGVGAWPAG